MAETEAVIQAGSLNSAFRDLNRNMAVTSTTFGGTARQAFLMETAFEKFGKTIRSLAAPILSIGSLWPMIESGARTLGALQEQANQTTRAFGDMGNAAKIQGEIIQGAMSLGISFGEYAGALQTATRFHAQLKMTNKEFMAGVKEAVAFGEATGMSAQQGAELFGKMRGYAKLSASEFRGLQQEILALQNTIGLTGDEISALAEGIAPVIKQMKNLGATKDDIMGLVSATGRMVAGFAAMGKSAGEATQFMERFMDPERFSENIVLFNQLGISGTQALNAIAGTNPGAMFEEMTKNLPMLSRKIVAMGPLAGAEMAKQFGLSWKEVLSFQDMGTEEFEKVMRKKEEARKKEELFQDQLNQTLRTWQRFFISLTQQWDMLKVEILGIFGAKNFQDLKTLPLEIIRGIVSIVKEFPISEWIRDIVKVIKEGVRVFFAVLKPFMNIIAGLFKGDELTRVSNALVNIFNYVGDLALKALPAFRWAIDKLATALEWVSSNADKIFRYIGDMWDKYIAPIVSKLGDMFDNLSGGQQAGLIAGGATAAMFGPEIIDSLFGGENAIGSSASKPMYVTQVDAPPPEEKSMGLLTKIALGTAAVKGLWNWWKTGSFSEGLATTMSDPVVGGAIGGAIGDTLGGTKGALIGTAIGAKLAPMVGEQILNVGKNLGKEQFNALNDKFMALVTEAAGKTNAELIKSGNIPAMLANASVGQAESGSSIGAQASLRSGDFIEAATNLDMMLGGTVDIVDSYNSNVGMLMGSVDKNTNDTIKKLVESNRETTAFLKEHYDDLGEDHIKMLQGVIRDTRDAVNDQFKKFASDSEKFIKIAAKKAVEPYSKVRIEIMDQLKKGLISPEDAKSALKQLQGSLKGLRDGILTSLNATASSLLGGGFSDKIGNAFKSVWLDIKIKMREALEDTFGKTALGKAAIGKVFGEKTAAIEQAAAGGVGIGLGIIEKRFQDALANGTASKLSAKSLVDGLNGVIMAGVGDSGAELNAGEKGKAAERARQILEEKAAKLISSTRLRRQLADEMNRELNKINENLDKLNGTAGANYRVNKQTAENTRKTKPIKLLDLNSLAIRANESRTSYVSYNSASGIQEGG